MKVGDAVKFIGFAGQPPADNKNPIGVIVQVHNENSETRYTVAWPDGTIGNWLYAQTLEVISVQ